MKRDAIKHLLPGIFQQSLRDGNPLHAILEVMEGLHAPSEEKLRTLDWNFDPRRAPDKFVPFLARWVDLDRIFEKSVGEAGAGKPAARLLATGLGRLRELIAAAAYLSQWRGTRKGLLLFLQTATGEAGFEIEESVRGPGGEPVPFHFRVRAPQKIAALRTLIERIIESEKPAYVTFELEFANKT